MDLVWEVRNFLINKPMSRTHKQVGTKVVIILFFHLLKRMKNGWHYIPPTLYN